MSQFIYNINKLSATTVATLLIVLLLIIAVFLQSHYKPRERFYSVDSQQQQQQIFPISPPHIETKTLLSWAAMAITASYDLNFVNYQQSLEGIRKYYTAKGYQKFKDAMNAENFLTDIAANKLVVAAVPIGAPVILKEGVYKENSYAWKIQIPILVSFQGPNEDVKRKFSITLLITRVATYDAPNGIGIEQFNAQNIT